MHLITLLSATLASAADLAPLDDATLLDVKTRNLNVQRAGMGVLAGWGGANLVLGGVGWATTEPGRTQAFWQGNGAWNTVNLGIAGVSLASLPAREREPLTEMAVRKQVRNFETALAVNAGLDVGYVVTGFVLRGVGKRRDDQRMRGFGDALLLQGGFLFAFDAVLLAISRRESRALRQGPGRR